MKPLILSLLLLTAACAGTGPRSPEERQNAAAANACRQEAERMMRFRERAQTMRRDEADSRLGAGPFSDSVSGSMSTDRLAARYELDQMVAECLRGAREGGAPPAGSGRGS